MSSAVYYCPVCKIGILSCVSSRQNEESYTKHPMEAERAQSWYCTGLECGARFINIIPESKLVRVNGVVPTKWREKFLKKHGML